MGRGCHHLCVPQKLRIGHARRHFGRLRVVRFSLRVSANFETNARLQCRTDRCDHGWIGLPLPLIIPFGGRTSTGVCAADNHRYGQHRAPALGRGVRNNQHAARSGGAFGTPIFATIITKRKKYHSNIIGDAARRETVRARIEKMAGCVSAHGTIDRWPKHITER
jgi:hypothetical protein